MQDITVTWTPEGKQLATERAKLPAKDEVVLVPAGPFLMGSTKQVDRNATFALPVLFLGLDAAMIVGIGWGLSLLAILSFWMACAEDCAVEGDPGTCVYWHVCGRDYPFSWRMDTRAVLMNERTHVFKRSGCSGRKAPRRCVLRNGTDPLAKIN